MAFIPQHNSQRDTPLMDGETAPGGGGTDRDAMSEAPELSGPVGRTGCLPQQRGRA